MRPYHHRDAGAERLHQHSRRTHHRAPPFVGKRGRSRYVHIRHRHDDQRHDPGLMHRRAAQLGGIAMAKLVQQLQQRKGQRQDRQVVARQHAVGQIAGQLAPMQRRLHRPPADHRQP
jgi:hypothetical protein